MIEFTNGLDRLLQLLIIGEGAANLGDALAPHAELPRASTGVGHRQNEDVMALAARAFWAALAVPDGALQQRAAQQLAGDRQFADEFLALVQGSVLESFIRMIQRRPSASIANPSDLAVFRKHCDSTRSRAARIFAPESS